MVRLFKRGEWNQYIAGCIAGLSYGCCGIAYAWVNPVLLSIFSPRSGIVLTLRQVSWTATLPQLGSILSPLLSGYLADKIGRRTLLLLTAPVQAIIWITFALMDQQYGVIYVLRALQVYKAGRNQCNQSRGSFEQISKDSNLAIQQVISMKSSMLVVLVAVLVAVSHGFECPKDACKDADCSYAPTKQTCKGTFIPNGSFCGCCDQCLDYIKEGGKCTVLEELGNGLLMRGVCEPGLICHKYICTKVDVPPLLNLAGEGGKCTVEKDCAPGLICHENMCMQIDIPPFMRLTEEGGMCHGHEDCSPGFVCHLNVCRKVELPPFLRLQ